jgi:transcriptional regulator with XRE-family HTH domain
MSEQQLEPSSNSLTVNLAQNLATRRKALGWTQEYLAQHLDVDTETISRFERGVTIPSIKTLEKLAGLLSVTACELLAQTSPPAPGNTEVIARFLETLPEADQTYVMETVRSLCHHLTAIRSIQS